MQGAVAALAGGLILAAAGGVAAAAVPPLEPLVRASESARRGDPDSVQAQYDLARAAEESLEGVSPAPACRLRYLALAQVVRGNLRAAEAFDRRDAPARARGEREIAAGRARHERGLATCAGALKVSARSRNSTRLIIVPRAREAFFGLVRTRVPAGASAAELRWQGRLVARAPVAQGMVWAVGLPAGARTGSGVLEVAFELRDGRTVGVATTVWLLPRAAAVAPRAVRPDAALADRLAVIGAGFSGYAGIYVRELATGRTAAWNADVRFPAASAVKLGVLAAALDRFGPAPEAGPLGYDMEALAAWSSNLAANRLLRALGNGDLTRGSRAVEERLRRLGADRSTYPGPYRVGTARAATPAEPPLVSARTTTARDLGRVLTAYHAAAAGGIVAQRAAGLSEHEARLGLALLLRSQPVGDNVGLVRPWLGQSLSVAQKHGWISSARHTAAIVYGSDGPVVVVVLAYRDGLTLRAAQELGRRVVAAAIG